MKKLRPKNREERIRRIEARQDKKVVTANLHACLRQAIRDGLITDDGGEFDLPTEFAQHWDLVREFFIEEGWIPEKASSSVDAVILKKTKEENSVVD